MRVLTARSLFLVGMLVVATCMPSTLMAQSSRDMANRLERLENEIQTLNHAIYRGAGSGASVSGLPSDPAGQANAEIRVQELEGEIRSLRGKMEEQSFEIRKLKQQVDALNSGVETRLGDLERGGSVSSSQGSSVQDFSQETVSTSQGDSFTFSTTAEMDAAGSGDLLGQDRGVAAPKNNLGTLGGMAGQDSAAGMYEDAFSLLKAANYEAAGVGFEAFLAKYPDHILSGNAKYWLGETHYVRKQFDVAARIFAEGFQKNPNGAKSADNLLKLGMSLANLGNVDDACVALGQLIKEDYKNAGPVVRRGEQERARLKCDE